MPAHALPSRAALISFHANLPTLAKRSERHAKNSHMLRTQIQALAEELEDWIIQIQDEGKLSFFSSFDSRIRSARAETKQIRHYPLLLALVESVVES